jgi:O-antigen/teichoic acid export membrane protein
MNQKKGGTILSFAAIFIKILVTFTYIPFVLDKIGKDNYGLFSVIGAIIAYIAILDFGINDSTLRFFVRYRKEESEEQKKQILGSVSTIYLILTRPFWYKTVAKSNCSLI